MFTAKEEFIMKGSDWIFSKVIYVELCYVVYSPLKGGTYIREPTELRNSKSLVNGRNRDQKCFLYSVLAKLYPAKRNPLLCIFEQGKHARNSLSCSYYTNFKI